MSRQVFVDTNVLINLVHIDRLDLLGKLDPFQFVVPAAVLEEIKKPLQKESVADALGKEWLGSTDVSGVRELTTYSDLLQEMGAGESACLTLASIRGGFLASSDKKRKFRRAAEDRIGRHRIIRLTDLLVRSIHLGLLTVGEADAYKESLAAKRFVIKIASFADLV